MASEDGSRSEIWKRDSIQALNTSGPPVGPRIREILTTGELWGLQNNWHHIENFNFSKLQARHADN